MRSKTSLTMDPLLYANEPCLSPKDRLHGFATEKYDPGIAENKLVGEESWQLPIYIRQRQMALSLSIAPSIFRHKSHCGSRLLKH
jgi:hypothetical protein